MGDVRVLKTFVGGGFGGKMEPTGLEFGGAVLSRLTGRPVKMFYDRAEMFAHNRGRHRQIMELTTGVDRNGKILGSYANFVMDGGAYTSLGIASAYYAGALLTLTYDFDNYKFDMLRVYTNLPACGAQRGHGAPQPKYAFECHLDNIARDLGIDSGGDTAPERQEAEHGHAQLFPDQLMRTDGLHREGAKRSQAGMRRGVSFPQGKGIGMAVGSFVSGAGYPIYRTDLPHAAAIIKVHEDGSAATLYTGATDIGQGSDTVLCQMAAEAMGIKYENMKIVSADTETTPHDFGAYASRQTLMSGAAVKEAGEMIKEQVLEMAGTMMELDPTELDCKDATVFVKSEP